MNNLSDPARLSFGRPIDAGWRLSHCPSNTESCPKVAVFFCGLLMLFAQHATILTIISESLIAPSRVLPGKCVTRDVPKRP